MSTRIIRNAVSAVLRERQWSHADLAAVTELPYLVVRRLVRDGSDPPLEYALRIARALQTPVEVLFSLPEER